MVADEEREVQVSEDWRHWWCPIIKAEWVSEKHAQLSQEAKEVTEMLRKQIFTNEMARAGDYAVGEVYGASEEEVATIAKGGGTSHCLAEYQTVLIPGCSRSQCGGYKW